VSAEQTTGLQDRRRSSRADLVAGILIACLGGALLIGALNMPLTGQDHVPGPGFFPSVLSGLLAALGLALAANAARSIRRGPEYEPATATVLDPNATQLAPPAPPLTKRGLGRVLIVWLAFAGTGFLVGVLGFVPAAAAFILFLLVGPSRRRTPRQIVWALVAAVVVPLAVNYIFTDLLSLLLPTGRFGWEFADVRALGSGMLDLGPTVA
jgi:putative tricarboxylic transport membrane protein